MDVEKRAAPGRRPFRPASSTALFDIGVLIGGPLLGVINSVSGYPATYGVAAVVMAAATVIYWRWDRRYDHEDLAEDVPAPAGWPRGRAIGGQPPT